MKFRRVKEYKGIYGLSRMALVNYEKKGLIKPLTEVTRSQVYGAGSDG